MKWTQPLIDELMEDVHHYVGNKSYAFSVFAQRHNLTTNAVSTFFYNNGLNKETRFVAMSPTHYYPNLRWSAKNFSEDMLKQVNKRSFRKIMNLLFGTSESNQQH